MAAVGGSALALWGAPMPGARATPASATERRFNQLDGVPLHYWRWNDGTAGRRAAPATFASEALFHDRLVRWVRDLRDLAGRFGGLRDMDRIVTAGLFVAKPGQHGLGRAFDIDQVRWSNGAITPYAREHASSDPATVRRYLALDAVCRRHFHWVLDGRYNAAHADHLHVDLADVPLRCDPASRSDTVFVQQVLNAHQGAGLAVDGAWGRATQGAFEESCARLRVEGDPHRRTDAWRWWLHQAAACGFADRPFDDPPAAVANPLQALLDGVEDLVEDLLRPASATARRLERVGLHQ